MYQLTISIVLYNNDVAEVKNVIGCVLQSKLQLKLFLIDNSPTPDLKIKLAELFKDSRIQYIFNNKNLGYGKAHNIALKKAIHESTYHLVLNPDVEFDKGVLEEIYCFMQQHKNVGLLLPKVFYKNGELQKLCNPLPAPVNLISRRFFVNAKWAKKINNEYELKEFDYDRCLNAPNLSGCFMFLRCEVLRKSGLFDERYFMYMEDVDLCRRIHAVAKTMYYPAANIIHGFEKQSYSSKKLLKHHIASAIKYFTKWGWVFDKERDEFNKKLFKELSNHKKQLNLNC